ncbi:MAG TPA: magnesium/cobalt transporter CorA [Longimicrobiales bacterium]
MRLTTFYRGPDRVYTDLSAADVVEAIHNAEGRIWVDVVLDGNAEWQALGQQLHLHPLTIEDSLNSESRIKVEEYENYLFVVVRDAEFDLDTPEPYDFDTWNLYLFIGVDFLITVHSRQSAAVDTISARLAAAPDLFDRGVDYLAYHVLDALVDSYFPLLDKVDDFIDELETGVFESADAKRTLTHIFDLKRTLLGLRRHQAPMREALATLANRPSQYLTPATQVYMRDVYDHVVRQVESIENFRDLLTGALEIHFSVVSNRMNEVMKALSVIATVILPATWVASIYGMNFEWMPWLHHPLGFWIAIGIMTGVSVVLMIWLRRKRMV